MRKNIAGQDVSFQMNATADGTVVTTGTPTVFYTIDGGAQATGGGASTHEGNGQWGYKPTQAETNGDHVAFTMILANAIAQTVNTWPVAFDPSDGDDLGLATIVVIAADVDGLNGATMRGTDGANTTVPDAAGVAPTAVQVRQEIDSNSTQLAAIKAETDNLPSAIKKNTALDNFEFFMRDSADNITGKTGLTVTAQKSIDGAAFANCVNATSEVSAGVYKIDLAAADLNGDTVTLKFTATGARATVVTIITKP